MAALVAENKINFLAIRNHLMNRLPAYARPLFLRIRDEIEVTRTFKYSKTDLVRQGYDPAFTTDTIYFPNAESHGFVRLDKALYDRIQGNRFACDLLRIDELGSANAEHTTKQWSGLPRECRNSPFVPTSLLRVAG
jgi:hypothetical protein